MCYKNTTLPYTQSSPGWLQLFFYLTRLVANDGKGPPCGNIKLLNKASQDWCRSKGWGMDTKGRWVQMKGGDQLKTPGVVGGTKEKVPEQKIYWTEGKRTQTDHIGQAPKGGWR